MGVGESFHFKKRVKSQMWDARHCPLVADGIATPNSHFGYCLATSSNRRLCKPAILLFGTYPSELSTGLPAAALSAFALN